MTVSIANSGGNIGSTTNTTATTGFTFSFGFTASNAGNRKQLAVAVMVDKSAGSFNAIAGWDLRETYIGASVSMALYTSQSAGQFDIVLSWAGPTNRQAAAGVVELESDTGHVDYDGSDQDDSNNAAVGSQASGFFTPSESVGFALAMFGMDTGNVGDQGQTYTNGFSEIIEESDDGSGSPGLWVAQLALSSTATISCTRSHTLFTDQMVGGILGFVESVDLGVPELAPTDLTHSYISDNVILTQNNQLAPDEVVHLQNAGSTNLTQHHQLAVSSLLQSMQIDSPVLTQHNSVVPNDMFHGQNLESTSLSVAGSVSVQGMVHNFTMNLTVLTQHNAISPDSMDHAMLTEESFLTQNSQISPDSVSYLQQIANTAILGVNGLNVEGMLQGQTLDVVLLTQHNTLAPFDMNHQQTIDNVSLVIAGAVYQAINELSLTADLEYGISSDQDIVVVFQPDLKV